MLEAAAVRVAIDLLQMPSRVRMIRQAPLPAGMELLLRVAAGDHGAAAEAAAATGRTESTISDAAGFFVEQVLLAPDADSYRVLGGVKESTAVDLRRNMALLVRWMHPDVAKGNDRARFVARVTFAWDDVKTPDRRQSYDSSRGRKIPPSGVVKQRSKGREPAGSGRAGSGRSLQAYQGQPVGLLRRLLFRLFRRET